MRFIAFKKRSIRNLEYGRKLPGMTFLFEGDKFWIRQPENTVSFITKYRTYPIYLSNPFW
jgi:hypothetical protein